MKKHKNFKRTAASVMAMALTISSLSVLSASAKDETLHTADQIPASLNDLSINFNNIFMGTESDSSPVSTYTVDDPENVPTAPAPEKFDLRDVDGKNYVTSVKLQNPYGTCWAFAAIAAAESSVAANLLDVDMNTATDAVKDMVDFSERHLAWFVYHPLTENSPLYTSQSGEGMINRGAENYLKETESPSQKDYNDLYFNSGGLVPFATSIFSSYQGPVNESVAPYVSDEGIYNGGAILVYLDSKPLLDISDEEKLAYVATLFEKMKPVSASSDEDLIRVLGENDALNKNGEPRICTFESTDDDSWWEGPGWYVKSIIPKEPSSSGTWAVDESKRFQSAYELEQSNILPSPCGIAEDGSYKFNEAGVNAIKQELVNKRAVSVAFHADQSMPGQVTEDGGYMSFVDENGNFTDDESSARYWCQYTYDKNYDPSDSQSINKSVSANHAVTIIGYDDNFPKEYFNDSNGTIGGNGAFIVKNSWGDSSSGTDWGSDGTGYFYLSYYDQSICEPESFSFSLRGDFDNEKLSVNTNQMYDLMPSYHYGEITFDQDTSMANVFVAEKDMLIDHVGYTAITCNEEVTYDIYLLDDDQETPEGCKSVSHLETTYQYGGFHRTELTTPVAVREGQKYAVKVTAKREDGNYGVALKAAHNEDGLFYFAGLFQESITLLENELKELKASPDADQDEIMKLEEEIMENQDNLEMTYNFIYGNAVVNKGESLLCIGDTWSDWTDILDKAADTEFAKYYEFDNFGIKTFGESEIVNLVNEVAEPKESYKAGDKVSCTITVKNNLAEELGGVVVYLGDEKLEALDTMKPGETKVVSYTHTVTEDEIKNGGFQTEASASLEEDNMSFPLNLMEEFSKPELEVSTGVQNITSDEELLDWVKVDYEKKTGVAVYPEYISKTDDKYEIAVKNKDGNLLDTYVIDPKTGTGINNTGDVDLPQTGMSGAHKAVAGLAALMGITGIALVKRSRKEDEE